LNAGTLDINAGGNASASPIGTGPLVILGGNLDNTSGASITRHAPNTEYWDTDFTFVGSNSLNLGPGPVNLGGYGTARTVTVSANTLETDGTVSGSGYGLTKTGTGVLVLGGANTYTGSTTITAGALRVNGSIASSSGVTVASGATLAGSGVVSSISGAGTVAPGAPAILTASQVDPGSGMSFDFHLGQVGAPNYGTPTASGNGLLHLTGTTPFVFSLTSSNIITVDFTGDLLQAGQTYYGGIFTDADITNSEIDNATFDYTGLNGAEVQFDGMEPVASATFTTGTVSNGEVMAFTVVPSVPAVPSWTLPILLLGFLAAAGSRMRIAGKSRPAS
jgi:autotransporter-associated beta strand protein